MLGALQYFVPAKAKGKRKKDCEKLGVAHVGHFKPRSRLRRIGKINVCWRYALTVRRSYKQPQPQILLVSSPLLAERQLKPFRLHFHGLFVVFFVAVSVLSQSIRRAVLTSFLRAFRRFLLL